ncbi:hypothetical protein AAFF_G00122840 [Aldrovandia affinis]|uniref:Notch C-terminal domain-containing protein n=1 Tax=Aldrovandia affinis TaxID=143900 RepID=A0AAD7RRH9_9TELE|nr:hypothetical protein AAFF_G00122840 [Aldrovandia affinis]
MYDGSTALILAARLAVEGMVEELITCHADVNAVDELGKSALHWAAAVNNVEATVALLKNGANKDMQDLKEETPLFLAAREGSCEAVKVLLGHFSNREITDHMDRLPRDIAQERMHHDIVQLLDEYNTVRSPPGHSHAHGHAHGHGHGGHHALSPLLCPPGAFMPGLKQPPQGKKSRRVGAKGGVAGLHGAGPKEAAAKSRSRKLTLDMQSSLLESSVTLSPVDSLDSPRGGGGGGGGASNAGYITNPASPALPSPGLFHPSLSVPATPMVRGVLEGGGPFAVSLAQLGELGDGMPLGRGPMTPGVGGGGPPGYVLNAGQLGLSLGMVNPVSVPFDWHRMPPASQCGQQVIGLVHSVGQSAAMQQQQQQQQHSHLQQMFRSAQQPLLQPTSVSAPQSHSPSQLSSIAEQQQQLHGHPMAPWAAPPLPPPSRARPLPPSSSSSSSSRPLPQPAQVQAPPPQAPSSSSAAAGLEDYPTPPSQHSYTSTLDATPKHYIHLPNEHPYLTPSPESPEPWSSPSPQCVSDWSDSTPSPAIAGPAQTQIPHAQESNGKMQVFA